MVDLENNHETLVCPRIQHPNPVCTDCAQDLLVTNSSSPESPCFVGEYKDLIMLDFSCRESLIPE